MIGNKKEPIMSKSIQEIMPEACMLKLRDFVEGLQNNTLIIEPGKMIVTMLRERVLEPFRDELLKESTGVHDLHYLAIVICKTLEIDPN